MQISFYCHKQYNYGIITAIIFIANHMGTMKRNSLAFILVSTFVAILLLWMLRVDLLLGIISYQADAQYDIAPHREIDWQQGPAVAVTDDQQRPPNIILIMADDLGFNDISTFGGGVAQGRVKTPHIDQLAADGVIFNQSYSGTASCAPSRAMAMTGRYPTRTGYEFTPTPGPMGAVLGVINKASGSTRPESIVHLGLFDEKVPYQNSGLPSSELTIAELLQQTGYHTVHIGKWHLGREQGMDPNSQGFDESLLMHSGLYLPKDHPNVVNAKLDFDPIDQFLWARLKYSASFNTSDRDPFKPGGYLTDYWTDESIKVIEANKHRPFFLYLAHWGVHTPLQATREDYEAVGDIQPHRLRVYGAMIHALDRSVGRIVQTLEQQGLADNTMILFTSDNGGAGYIGLSDTNAPYRGWKLTMFEGGIRVPLFIKWPANISPSTQRQTPVTHIDLMPTIAAAANTSVPDDIEIDGRNLLPLVDSQGEDSWDRQTLFWQSGHYRVVRHGDWKLHIAERPQKKWLFNLAEDPTEQANLARERPDKVSELMAMLDAHKATSRPILLPSEGEMAITVDKALNEPYEEGDEYIYWPN